MKVLMMAACVACVAMPADAQTWGGTPAAPTSMPINGQLINSYGLDDDPAPSYTRAARIYCRNTLTGQPQAEPCGPGTVPVLESGTYTFAPNGNPTSFTYFNTAGAATVPTGIDGDYSTVGIGVSGYFRDPNSPGGISYFNGKIPLSYFGQANVAAGQMATLSARIDAFVADQQAFLARAEREQTLAIRGVALASSLSLAAPLNGRANRLAFGLGSFGNETAMSINYTRQAGAFDLGIGAAVSDGDGLGKASVGFSW